MEEIQILVLAKVDSKIKKKKNEEFGIFYELHDLKWLILVSVAI